MSDHVFKIKVGQTTCDCKIEMDGRELTGVVRVSFDLNPESLSILRLEIMGLIEVDGEFNETALVKVGAGI